jgi:simple sugar transport system ATP-binding protein
VDVGAAAFLRQTLIDLSRSGVAILVISEELEELFEICDRIAVLAEGRLSEAVPKQQTNAEKIGMQMSGLFSDAPPTGSPPMPLLEARPTPSARMRLLAPSSPSA